MVEIGTYFACNIEVSALRTFMMKKEAGPSENERIRASMNVGKIRTGRPSLNGHVASEREA